MKANEFVKRMLAAKPTKEALLRAGRSSSFINQFLKSYECTKRHSPLKITPVAGSEEVIELFNQWNPGGIDIAGIEFLPEPVSTPRGIQIAREEIHPLLISPDGEIIVEEEGTKGHRLSEAAKSGNDFLDALVLAAVFFGKRGTGEIDHEDLNATSSAARDCATAAGGNKYQRFYRNLLGADE